MTTKKRISNRSKRTQESTDHKEVQLSTSVEFTGPLPPPAVLDGYEKILPGSASRILELVEKEQKHRHDTDQALIERTFTERRIGQGLGFVIGVVTVLTGGYVLCMVPSLPVV